MELRKIKFRGFNIDTQTWLYGDLVQFKDGTTIICNREYDEQKASSPVVPESVGQLSTETDKNGKDIYHGDIVRCFINGKEVGNLDEVEFKKGAFILGYRTVSLLEWNTMPNDSFGSELEVIGNLYQNSELLNK